jgi:hypothetical protein
MVRRAAAGLHASTLKCPVVLQVQRCKWGVFVTREHVRHNKSGITHRGKTRISH